MRNKELQSFAILLTCLLFLLYTPLIYCEYKTRGRSSFEVRFGSMGDLGFGVEGDISIGWELTRRVSLDFGAGGGSAEKRSGIGGYFFHSELLIPVTLNICRSQPRVCPGLELEVSPIVGVGYGWFYRTHALNLIIGAIIESLRREGKVDIGVRAGVYGYINLLNKEDILPLITLNLGMVLRWGGD